MRQSSKKCSRQVPSGEFYTPRALTEFMAEIVNPQIGKKMADFACGTGGFITSWLGELDKKVKTAEDRKEYNQSVFGIEKKQFPYMLCVTNLLLHGIDTPLVYHDNSLTKDVLNYTDEDKVDVVLMNPPYGGNEKSDVKSHFPSDMRSSETADLFMVLIMYRLKRKGRAAVIVPDGFLFGADNTKDRHQDQAAQRFQLAHHYPFAWQYLCTLHFDSHEHFVLRQHQCRECSRRLLNEGTHGFYRLDMPEGYKHFSKTKSMKSEHCNPIREWWNDRKEIIIADGDEKSLLFG